MRNLIGLILGLYLLVSCSPKTYYQLYQVESNSDPTKHAGDFVFENPRFIISYDLWDEGGDPGFLITNKLESNLFINLNETFFILNDYALDYSAEGQLEVEIIPPRASKRIGNFKINEYLIRHCDIARYPKRDDIRSAKFTQSTSPIRFRNRIAYSVSNAENWSAIENDFFVSSITNYPFFLATEMKDVEFCGEKNGSKERVYTKRGYNMFFIKYSSVINQSP